MKDAIAVVLGGGRGARLFPLTQYRSKPAVPIGASYRLVDVAVSNCIHANLRRIFVITQYQSESLNRHVSDTYKFDAFASGAIELLVAEQTDAKESDWFRGTADAVRKTMKHLARESWDHVVILSGDQLYRMDLVDMLRVHRQESAAVTVAMKAVPAAQTHGLGIMKVDPSGRVLHFDEKPPPERLPGLASTPPGAREPVYLASMGIYAFTRKALERAHRGCHAHRLRPSRAAAHAIQRARPGLFVRWLLGGRGDGALVLRSQSGIDAKGRGLQFLSPALPHLHATTVPGSYSVLLLPCP